MIRGFCSNILSITVLYLCFNLIFAQENVSKSSGTQKVKVSMDGLNFIMNSPLWQQWTKIPEADRKCIQNSVALSVNKYFQGSQVSLINMNSIKNSCSSFKAFQKIYQKVKARALKELVLMQKNLSQNLLNSYNNIAKVYENSRTKGFQESSKLELLKTISESLGNLTSEDVESLETTYPQSKTIDFGNLKDLIDDYIMKLNGTEIDEDSMKQKLQQFFNEISQGFLKKNNQN